MLEPEQTAQPIQAIEPHLHPCASTAAHTRTSVGAVNTVEITSTGPLFPVLPARRCPPLPRKTSTAARNNLGQVL
jgi:hypothetical protein